MVSLLARDLALMKLVWWGGAITSHWTGARSAGLSSARLGCLVRWSPRPVNSTVIAPRTKGKTCSLNHGLNGSAFSARLGADETCVVGRRYNKSLDRSAFSRLFIRKTRMPGSLVSAPGQFHRSAAALDDHRRKENTFGSSRFREPSVVSLK